MTSRAFRAGSDASVFAIIIDGKPWTASAIRNPHFRRACRALNRTFRLSNPVADLFRPWCQSLLPIIAERSRLFSEPHPLQNQIVPALVRMCGYSRSWLRDPEDWHPAPEDDPVTQWRDLLRHLFAEWPIPRFLDSVWLLPGCILILERRWYRHIGQGRSWRTAEKMPEAITRRALHHAMQAPDDLDVHQALRWGQLRSWNASDTLVAEVLQSKMVKDLDHEEEWSRLLEKVSSDPAFDPRDFGMIADLIRELLARSRTNHVNILLGLPLSELRDHCHRHWKKIYDYARACGIPFRHADMRHAGLRAELNHIGTARWSPMDEVASFEILRVSPAGTPSRWTISEQCSHVRLLTEAAYMRHCVGRYWRRCSKGNSAVFSLSQYPLEMEPGRMIPRLTIEVHPATRRVVQVRGKWNRPPDPFERNLIRIWAERNRLKLAV